MAIVKSCALEPTGTEVESVDEKAYLSEEMWQKLEEKTFICFIELKLHSALTFYTRIKFHIEAEVGTVANSIYPNVTK